MKKNMINQIKSVLYPQNNFERGLKMKIKLIVLMAIVLYFCFGIFVSYKIENDIVERTITTAYGDEFTIITDRQKKTQLINTEGDLSCRIHYYSSDDSIKALYDSNEIRVYRLSNVIFCKVKSKNVYIVPDRIDEDHLDVYEYLSNVIENDSKAKKYLQSTIDNYNRIKSTETAAHE